MIWLALFLTVTFAVLNLIGVIDWPWIAIAAPVIIALAWLSVFALMMFCLIVFIAIWED